MTTWWGIRETTKNKNHECWQQFFRLTLPLALGVNLNLKEQLFFSPLRSWSILINGETLMKTLALIDLLKLHKFSI